MMSTDERLAYMADQILRNFASKGHEAAIEATTDHIVQFWDPSMKARACALLNDSAVALSDGARSVFTRIRASQPAA